MESSRTSWIWPVASTVAALALALTAFMVTLNRVSGDAAEPTYYACLFAGSLTQVGTTPPANCGRGTLISWNSPPAQEPVEPPVEQPADDTPTVFWAFVSTAGELGRNFGVVDFHAFQPGSYVLYFAQDVTQCVYAASATNEGSPGFNPGFPLVRPDTIDTNGVRVTLLDTAGATNDGLGVYVQVFCPGGEGGEI